MKFLKKLRDKFNKEKEEVGNGPIISEPIFEELPVEKPIEKISTDLEEMEEANPEEMEDINPSQIEGYEDIEKFEEISEEKVKGILNVVKLYVSKIFKMVKSIKGIIPTKPSIESLLIEEKFEEDTSETEGKEKGILSNFKFLETKFPKIKFPTFKFSKKLKEKVESDPKAPSKKKLIVIVIIIVIIILAAAAFLILGDKIFEEKGAKVGYLIPSMEDTFQALILEAAIAEAKKKGIELEVQNAEENQDVQEEQILNMIKDGAEGLIVIPVNTSADMEGILEEASSAGISIVFVNRNPFENEVPDGVCYIGAKEYLAGQLQASYLKEILPQGGGVALLAGIPNNEGAMERMEAIENTLAVNSQYKILARESGLWLREKGKIMTEHWLKAYYNVEFNAILANNDEMALGAIEALEKEGRTDIIVMGIDGTIDGKEAVEDGRMAATVFQDPSAQGKGAIELMDKILNEEKAQKITLLDFTLITPQNVSEF